MLIRVYFIIGWYFELFDHMLMTCLLYMHVGYWFFFFFFFFVRISGLFDSLVFLFFFLPGPCFIFFDILWLYTLFHQGHIEYVHGHLQGSVFLFRGSFWHLWWGAFQRS